MTTITRDEHLQWCKDRALEYVTAGDLQQALASMLSDLRKHPETAQHIGIPLGSRLMMTGHLNTSADMRNWIESFN